MESTLYKRSLRARPVLPTSPAEVDAAVRDTRYAQLSSTIVALCKLTYMARADVLCRSSIHVMLVFA